MTGRIRCTILHVKFKHWFKLQFLYTHFFPQKWGWGIFWNKAHHYLAALSPKPGRRPNRTETFLSQKSLTESKKNIPSPRRCHQMTSKVFVRPGTGSHTEAPHWEQCEVSLIITRLVYIHVVPFVFLLPNITTFFIGKDWVGKRAGTRKEKSSSEKRGHYQEQDALADLEQVRWRESQHSQVRVL